MTGRRLKSRGDIEQDIDAALTIVESLDLPLELAHWAFVAAYNAVTMPPPFKDVEQAVADIREALDIAEARELSGPLLHQVAEVALTEVSRREHVVALPGAPPPPGSRR